MLEAGVCILCDHAVVHVVLLRARRQAAFSFSAAATTEVPSATSALSSTTCVVESQQLRLGKSRPAPKPLVAAQRQGEIRFPSFVTSTVVHGAGKEWDIDRCTPIPRSQESSGGATSRCIRASVTWFERHVEDIVAVPGRGQEQLGTRTQHRTQGQFAHLLICFRV